MNIERSFSFAFKAPFATRKLALGGVFSLLFFTVFFAFAVVGYVIRILCDVLEGRDANLPDWTDLKGLFSEGLQPVLIILAYGSPLIVLSFVEIQLQLAGLSTGLLLGPIGLLVAIPVSLVLPLALVRFITRGSLKAAFEFRKILEFFTRNVGTYLTAWGLAIAVSTSAAIIGIVPLAATLFLFPIFGMAALKIGLAVALVVWSFATFIASVISVHLYAQAYRASTPFSDDTDGTIRASMAMPPPLRGPQQEQ